jgi:hypothetical protein
MSPIEKKVRTMRDALRDAVEQLPGPVKMRARNAFEGFDSARQLLSVDREISSFRAITAEEEAVTALFRSLQLRKYPAADQLNLYSHSHKAAVAPFLSAVKMALVGENGELNIQLTIDIAKPGITINVLLKEFGIVIPGRENLSLQLVEPLGLLGGTEDGASPTAFYDRHIAKVATAVNVKNIMEFIKKEANTRNTLLYASDTDVPASKATEETIEFRQKRADTCLYLAIAVLQVKTHQTMAVQGLAAFLKMLGKAMGADPLYPTIAPDIVISKPK